MDALTDSTPLYPFIPYYHRKPCCVCSADMVFGNCGDEGEIDSNYGGSWVVNINHWEYLQICHQSQHIGVKSYDADHQSRDVFLSRDPSSTRSLRDPQGTSAVLQIALSTDVYDLSAKIEAWPGSIEVKDILEVMDMCFSLDPFIFLSQRVLGRQNTHTGTHTHTNVKDNNLETLVSR